MLYFVKSVVADLYYLLCGLAESPIYPPPPHASCCLLTKEFESVKVLARQLLSKYHACFFNLAPIPLP